MRRPRCGFRRRSSGFPGAGPRFARHGAKGAGGAGSLGIPAISEDGEIRSLEAMEADMIRLALGRYRGHMTEVAKRLKIGRSTLYRKMQDYGLEPRPN